ncbi:MULTISPECIES: proline dehydrogenase family protein [unclassified Nocardioides]|uniref:proline dehydrogenase family protein n=1 Tax=unclassified Nocardioides TaxID=2615069 RepID=UPI00070132E6|nr:MULTISPECIES: proline dehydrogenase family protein [unclassified Nocardioides]KRA29979.1 proline dehydrogenase [Nocardioides sp. Root614]KRA86900.1 proline dehydrogenase [Nocardioides sp. Root682]
MRPVRDSLLLLSRSGTVKKLVTTLPITSAMVHGYVPGETVREALAAVEELAARGIHTTIDRLGEDTLDEAQATATVTAYRILLDKIADHRLARHAEVSLKLTAIGLLLPDGERIALANARKICRTAAGAGTTVTIDMEDHTVTDATLGIVLALREEFPSTGAVLQAYLHRTEADCRTLAYAGSRVRLCKGAYDEPSDVAFTDPRDVDRSYVRCLKVLFAGEAYPMIATHDPRLIEIAASLSSRYGKAPGTYEFQMLYGIRPLEQQRLAASGEKVRVYLPYGEQWYGYLMRRLAERPQNLSLFLTSLISRK